MPSGIPLPPGYRYPGQAPVAEPSPVKTGGDPYSDANIKAYYAGIDPKIPNQPGIVDKYLGYMPQGNRTYGPPIPPPPVRSVAPPSTNSNPDSIYGSMAGESARNGNIPAVVALVKALSGGHSAPQGPSALDTMFNDLYASITTGGQHSQAAFDDALKAMGGNYDAVRKDLYNSYLTRHDDISGRASNLGVNYDNSDMGHKSDTSLRRIDSMMGTNLASDKNWVEKMKSLNGEQIDYLLRAAHTDKITKSQELAMAAVKAASSGRGKKEKKDSSGTSATQTETLNNVGDRAQYDSLSSSNPNAANLFMQNYIAAGLNPAAAMASIQGNITPSQRSSSAQTPEMMGETARQGMQSPRDALAALMNISGSFGNPKVKQVIKIKGKG